MIAPLTELHVEQEGEGKKKGGKGRVFSATLLAYARADSLWERGDGGADYHRPVYASFLGTEGSLRPFMANLQLGRRLALPEKSKSYSEKGLEFLKSAGYRVVWQREPEGSIATVYLHDLHKLDPGMVDPAGAKFVLMAPAALVRDASLDVAGAVAHVRRLPRTRAFNAPPEREGRKEWSEPLSEEYLASLVPLARLFAARLDRRTRAPMIPGDKFNLQILVASLAEGLATFSCARGDSSGWDRSWEGCTRKFPGFGFTESGTTAAGLMPGIAFSAGHDRIEQVLAAEVETYYAAEAGPRALAQLEVERARKAEAERAAREAQVRAEREKEEAEYRKRYGY